MLLGAKAYYAEHKSEFIMHWLDTYDPRVVGGAKWMPFVCFSRQAEYLQFLDELLADQENGLVEKARDMGASWLSLGWSVASWLFEKDFAIGWGSRIEDLVDRIGDPDSLFEKLRLLLGRMPKEFLPVGFNWKVHSAHMRLINPENGSVIMGEGGKNIGRGEAHHFIKPADIVAGMWVRSLDNSQKHYVEHVLTGGDLLTATRYYLNAGEFVPCVEPASIPVNAATPAVTHTRTHDIRWNIAGQLEQLWQGSDGSQDWREVPRIEPFKPHTYQRGDRVEYTSERTGDLMPGLRGRVVNLIDENSVEVMFYLRTIPATEFKVCHVDNLKHSD